MCKRWRVLLACLLLCLWYQPAHALEWANPNPSIAKKIPQYLLVLRYWGSVSKQDGDTILFSQGWVYMYEPYSSLDEVMHRLNTYTGQAMTPRERQDDLIGLWRLGEDRNVLDQTLTLTETPHEQQVVKEVKAWTEYRWKKK